VAPSKEIQELCEHLMGGGTSIKEAISSQEEQLKLLPRGKSR